MFDKNYTVANLSDEDIKKVKQAEQQINHGTDVSKILIAYDKTNS